MSDVDRACKKLDRWVDRYGDDVGYAVLEALLQKRAQDCRELSLEREEVRPITFEDIEGFE